ncbi:MAG: TetR family transcriptional regulator [Nocardioidaceae bacterium]|nr:TetR family transcriptional regulator [Nocardioidaceae bacterium]
MSRLSPERLEELYLGTLQLVADHGFESVTMDQIAEATKSSKATLYRQWGSKTGLVVQALNCVAVVPEEVADTGTLRGDLVAMVDRRQRVLDGEANLVGSILHALKSDTELRTAVRDQVIASVRTRFATVLDRAFERGEVDRLNPALPYVDLVLMAPYVLRLLIDDEPVDEAYLVDYLDAVVLPALGVRSTAL